MRIVGIILLSGMAVGTCAPVAVAQQAVEGMITRINRLNGTVAIRQAEGGTVGTNAAVADQEFKVQNGSLLDSVHAGDQVTYSTAESGGEKTIIKLQRKK